MSHLADRVGTAPAQVDPDGVTGTPFHERLLALVLVPVLVLSFVFLLRLSDRAVQLGDVFLSRSVYLLLLAALVVAIATAFTARLGRSALPRSLTPLALAATLGLCISPALVSWLSGHGTYSALGGVLPWSDASGYHVGGLQLLQTERLDSFNMRRPLNAGFYATRVALTGGDFWATMLIQGLVVGLAAFLILRLVTRRLGVAAGVGAAAVIFSYVRPSLGLTLTESLGVAVGCLALAALWQGVTSGRLWLFAVGLLMLTLALNIRSGPFFVLPLLVVWAALDARRAGRKIRRTLLITVGAVVAGFVLNMPMNALFGTGAGNTQGNFSFTLYGIAHGGIGWEAGYKDFAGGHFANEAQLTHAVYRAAFEEIRAHPGNLVRGIMKGYESYFGRTYGFVPLPANAALTLAMFVGWFGLLRPGPHRRLGTMLLAAWLGFLLSVPFIFQDGGQRVVAAFVPFLAVPPAMGFCMLARRAHPHPAPEVMPDLGQDAGSRRLTALACIAAIVVLVAAPPIAVWTYDRVEVPTLTCPSDRTPMVVTAGPGTAHITVVAPGAATDDFGEVTKAQFDSDMLTTGVEVGRGLTEIGAGSVVLSTYNMLASKGVGTPYALVVVPIDQFPRTRQVVSLCGRPSKDAAAASYGLVFADHLERVNR